MTAINHSFPASSASVLEARALTCIRGERELFSGLDLQVLAGQCLHIRGENGVGKTSLLRLLTGLTSPESGEILWNGHSIKKEASEYHGKLLFLGHRDALKEDLSAIENLRLYAAIDGITLSEQDAFASLWRFGLKGREDLPVNCLSAGQKKRVLMARMLTRGAQVWILDEPFNALDTHAMQVLQDLITEHLKSNGLVVLTSHQPVAIPGLRVLDL
ncbi:cytochrome c biogenesis heme-transporting ATPase CcmA [Polynucleobacter sp. MG-27-Goln-C1]|uniref:cytochrome c biogenesis heme-transporting ATPase CcmA n=1 Tax=Polynucleobacter sp. MG-27-Goln-C1 TaxID=1819726 RepID=UPI001C0D5D97|nr:cytochrome c biogenesis heme-transporting ATPase CcmA [Polynucleobacter sp. MG-27-Goln-C1]MBU3612107.1 cytochrome c biogenesis heme-transporting ATPase CcmA [Polynucleobacter sp. MG-27-Goln-C1]